MKTAKEIEKSVSESFVAEKYKAVCEMIEEAKLRIEYLKTPGGKKNSVEASGADVYKKELAQNELLLRLAQENLAFLKKKLK